MGESQLATQARIELEQTEQVILTEGALRREVVVAEARLAAIFAWASALIVVDRARDVVDVTRSVLGVLYLVWAIGAWRGVTQALKEPRSSMWVRRSNVWAVVIPVMDTAFNLALLTAPYPIPASLPALYRERAAIVFGLLIVFSVARKGWGNVALSVGLGLTGYFFTVYAPSYLYGIGPTSLWRGGSDLEVPVSSVFVTVGYCLLGFLIARTQLILRHDFRRAQRLNNLKRFLPTQIADRVFDHGDESLKPVSREVTVMFTDIRDFTSQSERMQPADVLAFLDDYFGHMTQIVKGHDGVVGKFIGDGMLAFWGVPESNLRHAEAALKAACDMRKKLVELNAHREAEGHPPIQIGVGVHTGVVAAGLLGRSESALSEYTVIGDAVNLASRIEGLNKKLGTDVLVSEETWAKTGGAFSGVRIGEEHVKGRVHPVVVYRIDAPVSAPSPLEEAVENGGAAIDSRSGI